MNYRPEIDGLRAVAVLPVVFFHANFPGWEGGYVGVDVFFVISGYLITTLIIAEFQKGIFSFTKFYERRARRLLPALLCVIYASVIAAFAVMLPFQLKDFFQSVVGTVTFSSNFLFWLERDYFSAAAEEKPLLHTWSLAVEEQFYILFPVVIYGLWRYGLKIIMSVLAIIAFLSLSLAHYNSTSIEFQGMARNISGNFYLLPSRIWELLGGSLCAIFYTRIRKGICTNNTCRNILSFVGLLLIIISISLFNENTNYPSLYTVLPVLGACLIVLFAQDDCMVTKFLQMKLPVFIGLLSYSLYLWHQPLFAFSRAYSVSELSAVFRVSIVFIAFTLAYGTWKFVEQPFRNSNEIRTTRFALTIVLLTVPLLLLSLIAVVKDGFASSFSPSITSMLSTPRGDLNSCHEMVRTGDSFCNLGPKNTVPTIAIIGDSHASVLAKSLNKQLPIKGKSAALYYGSWCPPLAGLYTSEIKKNPGCKAAIELANKNILENDDIKTVVLVAQWANYTQGFRWGEKEKTPYNYNEQINSDVNQNTNLFREALLDTIMKHKHSGKTIVIVKSVPEFQANIPVLLSKLALRNIDTKNIDALNITLEDYNVRNNEVIDSIDEVAEKLNLSVVEPLEIFCKESTCEFTRENKSLYIDDNHLSEYGASIMVSEILDIITP